MNSRDGLTNSAAEGGEESSYDILIKNNTKIQTIISTHRYEALEMFKTDAPASKMVALRMKHMSSIKSEIMGLTSHPSSSSLSALSTSSKLQELLVQSEEDAMQLHQIITSHRNEALEMFKTDAPASKMVALRMKNISAIKSAVSTLPLSSSVVQEHLVKSEEEAMELFQNKLSEGGYDSTKSSKKEMGNEVGEQVGFGDNSNDADLGGEEEKKLVGEDEGEEADKSLDMVSVSNHNDTRVSSLEGTLAIKTSSQATALANNYHPKSTEEEDARSEDTSGQSSPPPAADASSLAVTCTSLGGTKRKRSAEYSSPPSKSEEGEATGETTAETEEKDENNWKCNRRDTENASTRKRRGRGQQKLERKQELLTETSYNTVEQGKDLASSRRSIRERSTRFTAAHAQDSIRERCSNKRTESDKERVTKEASSSRSKSVVSLSPPTKENTTNMSKHESNTSSRALEDFPELGKGWKRETRPRKNTGSKSVDYYYYSPSGQRFRSLVQAKAHAKVAQAESEDDSGDESVNSAYQNTQATPFINSLVGPRLCKTKYESLFPLGNHGNRLHLGTFVLASDAALAYDLALKLLNVPGSQPNFAHGHHHIDMRTREMRARGLDEVDLEDTLAEISKRLSGIASNITTPAVSSYKYTITEGALAEMESNVNDIVSKVFSFESFEVSGYKITEEAVVEIKAKVDDGVTKKWSPSHALITGRMATAEKVQPSKSSSGKSGKGSSLSGLYRWIVYACTRDENEIGNAIAVFTSPLKAQKLVGARGGRNYEDTFKIANFEVGVARRWTRTNRGVFIGQWWIKMVDATTLHTCHDISSDTPVDPKSI